MGRRPILLTLLASALALIPLAAQEKNPDKKDAKTTEIQLSEDEQAVIDLTNAERKKADKDLRPLKTNAMLMAAACKHAARTSRWVRRRRRRSSRGG
jgi:uncharacterized protein YkwD